MSTSTADSPFPETNAMIRKRTNNRSLDGQKSNLWQKCTNFRSLKQIHASLVVGGFNSNRSALRELVFCGSIVIPVALRYVHQVFDQISDPDAFMWNTMIRGYAQSLKPAKAVSLYSQMEERGFKPDQYTFTFVLKACTKLLWQNLGLAVHGKVVKLGYGENTFIRNTLIYFHANCGDLGFASKLFDDSAKKHVVAWSALTAGYAKRGDLGIARKLFDEMPIKDLVSWNVMITGYAKRGEMDGAKELFDKVAEKDAVTWNAMIAGYVLCGLHKEALEMFDDMRGAGEQPDEVTMLSVISACAGLGDLDIGAKMHFYVMDMVSRGGDISIPVFNALIDMYAKCGSIERAVKMFREMKDRDVSSWNSVIVGLAFHGHALESINLFEEMKNLRTKPNEVTFVGVIVACSHAGKVEEGRQYFKLMREVYKIKPNIKHYGCMVDLLGRAGLLSEAFEFVESMDIEPNPIIWRTLLGACRIHGNVELGRRANERLLNMRHNESGDYVLLANIYASSGEWDGVQRVRKMFDDSGVRKEPGFSLIEYEDDKVMLRVLLEPEANSRTRDLVAN